MESLPLEIFCLVASFLAPRDLLRVSLVSRSLRAQARTVAAWESCLASHRPSDPLFYLESLNTLNTDIVVVAAMKADPKGVSSVGEDLFEAAQELKPRNPKLVDRLARQVFRVPPLFAVKDPECWADNFDREEIYQVEEDQDEEDHEDDQENEDHEDEVDQGRRFTPIVAMTGSSSLAMIRWSSWLAIAATARSLKCFVRPRISVGVWAHAIVFGRLL